MYKIDTNAQNYIDDITIPEAVPWKSSEATRTTDEFTRFDPRVTMI